MFGICHHFRPQKGAFDLTRFVLFDGRCKGPQEGAKNLLKEIKRATNQPKVLVLENTIQSAVIFLYFELCMSSI